MKFYRGGSSPGGDLFFRTCAMRGLKKCKNDSRENDVNWKINITVGVVGQFQTKI